ncbi:hypothetical protein [Gimesia chilikensis]|uniref:hypothetical protein n=1 Tax=Gimesia chilikensis TaxID=2605989 RepID=UPI00118BAF26|nr:hypothetical protein [Gimesia chilikensis]QDT86441.1 hypothetical protein MalM14_41170 [Gimesia chilikensis]
MLHAGAIVYRSHQSEIIGDFIVIFKGIAYGVELGAGSKTPKQLRDLFEKIGEMEKVAGTVEEVLDIILEN